MTSELDIKRLWGLAAGMCSKPGCGVDCIPHLVAGDPTIIGEMAHVIARKPSGPRGSPQGGSDSYENLILLCPNCHKTVDKAPTDTYAEEVLHAWKRQHEGEVRDRLAAPIMRSRVELATRILRLLIENHATWQQYGPDSDAAKANPVSNVAELWTLRKIAQVIPRNTAIVRLLEANAALFGPEEYAVARRFVEHAAGFEASAYERREDVPRFPDGFEEMIRRVAAE